MIEEVRLDDLLTLQRGFDITEKEQKAGSVPVISSGGISSYHSEFKVKGPGVVIGRKGTLGKVYFTAENYWPHDTSLWVKDFKGNDPKFIYYLLQVLHFEKFDAGAANPTLNRNHVHSLRLKVPKKEYRTIIATILSSYDELIENNNLRIKLLEEMAEEIYKEWFVRMRFPGYENTNFFDAHGKVVAHGTLGALPGDWEMKPICKLSSLDKGPSLNYEIPQEEGIPVINQSCIRNGVIDLQRVLYSEDVPKNKSNCYLQQNDILINSMGDGTLGRVSRNVNLLNDKYIIHNCITFLRSKEEYSQYLLYYIVVQNQNYFLAVAQGSTGQSTLKKELIGAIKAIVPEDSIMNKYDAIIAPMWTEIGILLNKNILLQQTRDLLLPRLISGKLSVEHLLDEEENLFMAAEPEIAYGKN